MVSLTNDAALPPQGRTVILTYPPASSVWHLPAGTAQLTGLLESHGHRVIQRYAHITAVEHVLKEQGGAAIDQALAVIREPGSDILSRYQARTAIERASREIETSDRFSVRRNNINFTSKHHLMTIEDMLEAVKDREEHLWYSYFLNVEVAYAKEVQPDIYGISIVDGRQLIPGIILASLVKDALPDCKVVLGGNFWPRMTEAFKHPEFALMFDICDAIVYREGYRPFEELARTLDPQKASGTVWRDGNSVVVNPPTATPHDFQSLPAPVFDRSVRQWSHNFMPSLYTASGCYMACSFCDISGGSDTFLGKVRAMSPSRTAEHMIATGATRFDFTNEMLTIKDQLRLGEELKKRGYEATWACYMTATQHLRDPAICRQLYDAGCRLVQLGLESLAPETLKQESKSWNTPANYDVILRNLKEAGIQAHAFIMVGIPGEPLHRALAWIPFLEKYGHLILTIACGRYRHVRLAPQASDENLGRLVSVEPDTQPMNPNLQFKYADKATSATRVQAVLDVIEEYRLRNHWAAQVTSTVPWWTNRGDYSWEQLEEMAREMKSRPDVFLSEGSGRHIEGGKNAAEKKRSAVHVVNSVLKEHLGYDPGIHTFNELVEACRSLL